MQSVEVIVVAYHAGLQNSRVGKGPTRLLELGLEAALRETERTVCISHIPPVDDFEGEIGRSFELKRRVAAAVAAAIAGGRSIVLAGNCNTAVGVHAGVNDAEAGVVWFDAHPDFNTPDECMSGYFDGMGVATLAGQCWSRLAASIPGFRPLDLSRLVYCGIRDFEPGQLEKVEAHGVRRVVGSTDHPVPFAKELALTLASAPFDRAIIHLDLDCLDTSVGRANQYAAPGGLSVIDLINCLERTCACVRPIAMTIASFDPDFENGDRIAAAGIAAAKLVAGCKPRMGPENISV